jgi:ABC-type uncharacterized transport system substrate-binding protein
MIDLHDPEGFAHTLAALLSGHRYRYSSETDLQAAIAKLLDRAGIDYRREFRLCELDRPDFMVGDVAIEVKIDGSLASVVRQIARYAEHDEVRAIVLVSTRAVHRSIPATFNGKPVVLASLLGGAF